MLKTPVHCPEVQTPRNLNFRLKPLRGPRVWGPVSKSWHPSLFVPGFYSTGFFVQLLTEMCTQIIKDLIFGGVSPNKNVARNNTVDGRLILTNNVLTQTLLVGIRRPSTVYITSNVPKTKKRNHSNFRLPMPLQNILKCHSPATSNVIVNRTTLNFAHIPPTVTHPNLRREPGKKSG